MIRTKQDLIKRIEKLSHQTLDLGIELKTLALSIKHQKDKKTLAEWKEVVKPYLDKLERNLENENN